MPWTAWKRRRLRSEPFPKHWRTILRARIPLLAYLPDRYVDNLRWMIQVFVREKQFIGREGLEITEEVKVTIAAQACLLLLGRDKPAFFPGFHTIFVFPDRYLAPGNVRLPGNVVTTSDQIRAGEAWLRGSVVLSWRDVTHGAAQPGDGHNVVLHEFAHKLDGETGHVNGAPRLDRPRSYTCWARIMGDEYKRLLDDVRSGRPTLLNAYGGTNPAEFFAVVTETFFEQPHALRDQHPELYDTVANYYNLDPASWLEGHQHVA
jgi:MtfA peptidase